MTKKAIIIGAGPAGLTAAYELLKRTDIKPIILEKSGDIGGISKTINYKGNRMDMEIPPMSPLFSSIMGFISVLFKSS